MTIESDVAAHYGRADLAAASFVDAHGCEVAMHERRPITHGGALQCG